MRSGVGIIASSVVASAGTDVLFEDFENFTDAPWTSTGSPAIAAARTGNGCALGGATSNVRYTVPSGSRSTTVTIGFAYRVSSLAANRHPLVLHSGGFTVSETVLRVTTTGALAVLRGGTAGTVLGTTAATGLVVINTFVYLELQVTLANAPDGAATVRVNGVERLALTGVDTLFSASPTVYDTVQVAPAGSGITTLTDDLYITTGAGAPFKGDITIP